MSGTAHRRATTTPTVALVTGATKGIGLETARQLAAAGCTVLIGARDAVVGCERADELRREGFDVVSISLDVTDAASIARAESWIRDTYGRLDILVNNAGVLLEADLAKAAESIDSMFLKPFDVSTDILLQTFQVNTFGPIAVANAMLPLLRKSEDARILNVSSALASFDRAKAMAAKAVGATGDDPTYPNILAYNSSKAALNAATMQLVIALRGTGIRVNCVDPGHCATDINGHTGERSAADAAEVICERLLDGGDATGKFWDQDGEAPW
jgi:NAD(P)-dependent dehydrogenase (short-subunit alcohol dehydrogenase family)